MERRGWMRGAIAALGLVLATGVMTVAGASTPAGADEFCGFATFVNGTDEDLKVRRVVDGREQRVLVLRPGVAEFVRIELDQPVLVRRPSDRARLWTQSEGCGDADEIIRFGDPVPPRLTCGSDQLVDGGPIGIGVVPRFVEDGMRIALNLDRGDRTGENFEFLGRFAPGDGQLVRWTGSPDIAPGVWTARARVVFADGTKGDRVACGEIVITDEPPELEFPREVDDQRRIEDVETTCWAAHRLQDGDRVSDVIIRNAGGATSLNYRGDEGWLATERPAFGAFGGTVTRGPIPGEVTTVIIRGGENPQTLACEVDWTGPAQLDGASPDFTSVVIEDIVERADGSKVVVWRSRDGGGIATSIGWVTDTRAGTVTRIGEGFIQSTLVDCDDRHVAITNGTEYFVFDTEDQTLELVTTARELERGEAVLEGFDCEGAYWWAFDGRIVRFEL